MVEYYCFTCNNNENDGSNHYNTWVKQNINKTFELQNSCNTDRNVGSFV